MPQTQHQMYEAARRQIAEGNALFLEMIDHPSNPLTAEDLVALIRRAPERWSRFSNWVPILRQREQESAT